MNFSVDPVIWKKPPNSEPTIGRGIFLERTKPVASPATSSTSNGKQSRAKRKPAKPSASQTFSPPSLATGTTVSVPSVGIVLLPRGPATTIVIKKQGDLLTAQDARFNIMMQLTMLFWIGLRLEWIELIPAARLTHYTVW